MLKAPNKVYKWWRAKYLEPSFDADITYESEYEFAFSVAKVLHEDVLKLYKDELQNAIKSGLTLEQFKANIQPRLERAGWWGKQAVTDPVTGRTVKYNPPSRLTNIYTTNIQSARAQGFWEKVQKNVRDRPYLMYITGDSKEHRPEHQRWEGTLLPADHEWWKTFLFPNGYGCRCSAVSLNEIEYTRATITGYHNGIKVRTEPLPVEYVEYVNRITGERKRIPKGIDAGFENTPTTNRQRALK